MTATNAARYWEARMDRTEPRRTRNRREIRRGRAAEQGR